MIDERQVLQLRGLIRLREFANFRDYRGKLLAVNFTANIRVNWFFKYPVGEIDGLQKESVYSEPRSGFLAARPN